ncbi:HEAT repeat domain-containing protein [Rheinheimera hassiensis]|uniref:HEAT repeat domain-containing protein n=1 Tax=Rheinheimera hassiensis TaxID=1193627 RepID=UPI001F06C126|nr:HEAT repeat domain-containing protein [Rheinheimera hassiensis]
MKQIACICFLLFSVAAMAIDESIVADSCFTPAACIAKVASVVDKQRGPGQYPSAAEQAIIKKLLAFGDDAMPAIMQLLDDNDELIARVGAVALREAEHIDKKYLPQIVRGLDRDVSWLAPALAKVGTAEAAEIAVKAFLASRSSPGNQEAYAVRLFGTKALPAILNAVKCQYGCNHKTYYLLGDVLARMGEQRVDVALALIDIAEDRSLSDDIRVGVLSILGDLGKPAVIIDGRLMTLKEQQPQLTKAINKALVDIKSQFAVNILVESLAETGDINSLRDIAEFGPIAVDAGVVVMNLFTSMDPEAKLLAVRTLGYIGYSPSIPYLIPLLNEPNDVLLNLVTAEALGRLNAKSALTELTTAADSHWYPPVRDQARKAVELIKTGQRYENKTDENNFGYEYFNFQNFQLNACEKITLKTISERSEQKLYKSKSSEKLQSLAYNTVVLGYGADDEDAQKAVDPDAIIEVNANNIREIRHNIEQVPDLALRVKNGWLAGSNRGEWGGELVYIADNGASTIILDENIEDIYKLSDRYVAVTGLSHLGSNNGMIYHLIHDDTGQWRAEEWLKLPGAPHSSWFVETGELLINTSGGGSLLLSKHGLLRMATCR